MIEKNALIQIFERIQSREINEFREVFYRRWEIVDSHRVKNRE